MDISFDDDTAVASTIDATGLSTAALAVLDSSLVESMGPALMNVASAIAGQMAALESSLAPAVANIASAMEAMRPAIAQVAELESSLLGSVGPALMNVASAIAEHMTVLESSLAPAVANIASAMEAMQPAIAQVAVLESSLVASMTPTITSIVSMMDAAGYCRGWGSNGLIVDGSASLFDEVSIGLGLSGHLAPEVDPQSSADKEFGEVVRNAWSASVDERGADVASADVLRWADDDGQFGVLPSCCAALIVGAMIWTSDLLLNGDASPYVAMGGAAVAYRWLRTHGAPGATGKMV